MSCLRARERWIWNGNGDSSFVPSSYLGGGKERLLEGKRPPFCQGLNIPVAIIEVNIFIQTPMILPYLARVRITIAAAQVLRDRRSAAANVVVVIFEGFQ